MQYLHMLKIVNRLLNILVLLLFTQNAMADTTWFITKWQTTAANEGIMIPMYRPSYTYDYDIDCDNDGTFERIGVTGAVAGEHIINIRGTFPAIYIANSSIKTKILDVMQWGSIVWGSMNNAFYGASNLQITATDSPDLSNVTSMSSMFKNASNFNQPLNNWNVSNVTNMFGVFEGAYAFNQDLSSWDISSVTFISVMFNGVTLSTGNYNALLVAWDALTLQPGISFHGGNSKYTSGSAAETARSNMISTDSWNIIDGGATTLDVTSFTTKWETTTSNEDITIPTNSGSYTYLYDIDCDNDGSFEQTNVTGDGTCTFATASEQIIRIRGTFPAIYINDNSLIRMKILDVMQWGNIAWESMSRAFKGARNLLVTASDSPILNNVTDMSYMFNWAVVFNSNLNSWNVSNVTNMSNMFQYADTFNQDISSWDVSNVTDMSEMFFSVDTFNQDLSSWDVGNVTSMYRMFYGTVFNQDISSWNVSNVTNMFDMFSGVSSFNQDISSWDVSSVTDMAFMFNGVSSFNQDISNWDVSNVCGKCLQVQMLLTKT